MTTSIKASVKAYEAWLGTALGGDLVGADLRAKHKKMRDGAFPFLRATYWRWAETILEICPNLATAQPVLAIGDTHVENFGCWRDAEGRLVWGANDFDDAAVDAMPDPTAAFAAFPRSSGLGSLGRPRFVARTAWRGGPVLREAKAVVVSAWVLRHGGDATVRIADIAGGPFRAVDPHYRVFDGVVVRRLSPSSRKIEAKDSKDQALLLSLDMLTAMGREIAACHAGDRDRAPALGQHLLTLPPSWLHDHARVAARQVEADQAVFSRE